MTVYSVDTEEEANSLLVLTCPRNTNGEFVATELAEEQTLDKLFDFGDRLAASHAKMLEREQQRLFPEDGPYKDKR